MISKLTWSPGYKPPSGWTFTDKDCAVIWVAVGVTGGGAWVGMIGVWVEAGTGVTRETENPVSIVITWQAETSIASAISTNNGRRMDVIIAASHVMQAAINQLLTEKVQISPLVK
jgi:hypothetical protein